MKMSNLAYEKYTTFFLILKTAYQKKQSFFIYPSRNPQLLSILKKLQEKSLIRSYSSINTVGIQVFLRYDIKNLPPINNIFFFPKHRIISLKQLKSFENDYPLALSLLNTKFGILDMTECQKKSCGGEILVTIS